MDSLGHAARVVLMLGLSAFVVLAFWPAGGKYAVFAVLYTPILASLAIAIALFLRRSYWQSLSLFTAITLILTIVLLHRR